MKKSGNKKVSIKKTTVKKAAPKKTAVKKKVTPKMTTPKPIIKKRKTKRVAKTTDPRMMKLQEQQKVLAVEEAKVKAQIKKEQQAIKSADAKCMSNAKNLNKHVMNIKAGLAEFSRALKASDNSNAVEAATEKMANKIQVLIDGVRVVRDLKFDVLKLIAGEESEDDFDDL